MRLSYIFLLTMLPCIIVAQSIRQIAYVSNTASPYGLSQEEIDDVLLVCRRNNRVLGVTGILLSHETMLFQLVESEPDIIEKLMINIQKDVRHRQITIIMDRLVDERSFSGWEMAFKDLRYTQMMNEWAARQDFDQLHNSIMHPDNEVQNDVTGKVHLLLQVYKKLILGLE